MIILGVDVGGSGIKAAPVNIQTGEMITKRKRISTPKPATPMAIALTIKELAEWFEWSGSIGCGFPAAIQNGLAMTATNIAPSCKGVNMSQMIAKVTGLPTQLRNDADVAGLAEIHHGAGKGHKGVVLMITIGTGIGTALFLGGQLVPNTELGHLLLHGDLAERYCSEAVRKKKDLSWEVWARRFNEYLLHIEKLLYPDLIILGGGISKRFASYSRYFDLKTEVVPAQLRNHAGIIGAALAAAPYFR